MAKNIFTRFDSIVKNAGLGRKYALHAYMRYTDLFNKDDREQVESFRKLYNENGNNVTVMEKAGYSDYQIDVIDRFVAFCQNLPCTKFTGWLRYVFSRRRAIKEREYRIQNAADVKASSKKELKDYSTEKDFLKNRYFEQQQFFSKKSGQFKDEYHRNQKRIMLFSVSVSVISVLSVFVGNVVCSIFHFESSPEWLVNGFSLLVAVISAITAYISSNDKLFQNLDFWVRYRVASEKLKSEYALYQGRCGDYNIPDDVEDNFGHTFAEKRFRENVEAIVQEANDNFTKILQNGNNTPQISDNEKVSLPQPKSIELPSKKEDSKQEEHNQEESKHEEPSADVDAALPEEEDFPPIDESAAPEEFPEPPHEEDFAEPPQEDDFVEPDAQG